MIGFGFLDVQRGVSERSGNDVVNNEQIGDSHNVNEMAPQIGCCSSLLSRVISPTPCHCSRAPKPRVPGWGL